MIDMHCHFLPGIDDGAASIEEAEALCAHALKSGITHSVLTPHLHLSRYENFRDSIAKACDELQRHIATKGIELELGFAAEVRICPEIMTWVEQGLIPYLGQYENHDVLLLEMPHNQLPPGWDNLFRWLINNNIRPMIAHPERNKEIMAHPEKVLPMYNAGALFQLTAGAVAGQFGERCRNTADYILSQGIATVIASDAHNLKHRPPELEHGRRRVEQLLGESASWDMVLVTPAAITAKQFGDNPNEVPSYR
jgi:protein-tyrosine phosphatase